jgi:CotH kinase protein/Lamin Tail Domain/Secretion system C-terminal sorting domain
MNKILTFSLCTLLSQTVVAQHVPERMHFEENGRRLITGNIPSTGFYNQSTVETVELTFTQANYWSLLTSNYASKTDLPATLTYKGKSYPNVGVRFRGNTSYQQVTSQKKSFSIKMDYLDPLQDLKGYQTLHFNNASEDPSMMHEVLYLDFERRHLPAAKANFIHLKINGQSFGVYPNVQVLNKEFFGEWFLNNDGTRWRAEKPSGAGGGGGGFGAGTSTLNNLGLDTNSYKSNYNLKASSKTRPWDDLVKACATMGTLPAATIEDSLKKVFDTDRALWFVAHEIMFGDDDSYIEKGGMDYYVYWDSASRRITPIEYDGNTALGSTGAAWSPLYKETNTSFPIPNKLFAVPALRQRYLAHVRTMLEQYLSADTITQRINYFYNMVDSLVQPATIRNFSNAQFATAKTTVTNFLNSRRAVYSSHAEVNRPYPAISNVLYKADAADFSAPTANQVCNVKANITFAAGIQRVNLYYGTDFDGYFNKTQLFDDGQHQDGAANDGIFGGSIPAFARGTYVRFYVEAVANDGNGTVAYMPKGAEHDVYIYQVKTNASPITSVTVNEIMASNASTAADPAGQFDDWIELYNKTANPVNLSGFFLSDDPANRDKWQFPVGTTIAPNGFLIVWADEDGSQQGLHAKFKLTAQGESVIFSDPDMNVIDEVVFGPQITDKGFARRPNGIGSFVIQQATFAISNEWVGTGELTPAEVRLYPNPTSKGVTLELPDNQTVALQIVNLLGQPVHRATVSGKIFIDTSHWLSGTYIVKIGNLVKKLVID